MTPRLLERSAMKLFRIKVFGGVSILKMAKMHSFTPASKTPDLLFQNIFKLNQCSKWKY